jgi:ATP-dependent Lhr-like helicase
MTADMLTSFLPATAAWFSGHYGQPTPPQELGWPAIQRGEHVLILSPTGSGKTMAAFLWGIDRVFHQLADDPTLPGVQLLYISPLKALSNDIGRNLYAPLHGIRAQARRMGLELPEIRHAVRTGDTPPSERQAMVRTAPHILVTTPESLYLLLTSAKARDMLRLVRTVIVDEIHTLCGNKRGVHLALSLERLQHLASQPVQRIGLSATQRPLDEVGRFLAGQEWERDEQGQERLVSRAVTIVDAGAHKDLDIKVITAVPDIRRLPGGSIWPAVIPQVLQDVRRGRTTLIFTNGRRGAERAADRLNEQYALETAEELEPGSSAALLEDGVPKGQGMFGTGRVGGPFKAHHGSVSREMRLDLERQLKAGRLPALVATSSLELGIDVGEVDTVVQLQSPRGIARGLQRVGRSGHLVGQTSVGRIYATHREDILDAATVAHGMLRGDIEPTYTPRNCLDVLAQQIVACVAGDDWGQDDLYHLVCQAYGYQGLTPTAFEAVLKMLGGGYPADVFRELRPRLSWDRVNHRLAALPGTRLTALRNPGTITDRGEFRVVLPDGQTTLGTLDEEFVFETRKGDAFALGSSTWRVLEITEDRIVVSDAAGAMPRMPFWHGEAPKRDYHMGLALGRFRRLLAERVADLPTLPDDAGAEWPEEARAVIEWLDEDYCLDEPSARNAILYVRQQLDALGAISSDRVVIVESFSDALGDQRLAIHSPFGARVNSAWALALANAMREALGIDIETQVNDDGILYHLPLLDRQPPTALVAEMGPEEARERLLVELPNSALFGAEFRMNAQRSLLLPRMRGGQQRRTPFWLQRLRARSLLSAAKSFDDFPLIAETYRSSLSDVLDLGHLIEVLASIRAGEIRVVVAETLVPSPVAASLLTEYMAEAMYEWDSPRAERQIQALSLDRELLSQLLDEGVLPELLRPEAIEAVGQELQHSAESYRARSAEELAVILADLGDLSADQVAERCLGGGPAWLLGLAAEGRACRVNLPVSGGHEQRWVMAEHYGRYRDAFALAGEPPIVIPVELLEPRRAPSAARETVLRALLRTHTPLTRQQILARYAFPAGWLDETLSELVGSGHLVSGHLTPGTAERQWCDRYVLERIHRRTLAMLRQEVQPVELAALADFCLRWQGLHPAHMLTDDEGVEESLELLCGASAPYVVWERDLLPLRAGRAVRLDALPQRDAWCWSASGKEVRQARLRLFRRGDGALFAESAPPEQEPKVNASASLVLHHLTNAGARYTAEVQRAVDLASNELRGALVELVLAGLITNDRFDTLAQLDEQNWGRPATDGLASSLDRDLAEWRRERGPRSIARPSRERLHQARRQVTQRVAPRQCPQGRWMALSSYGVRGEELPADDRAALQAQLLLARYGLVTREVVASEEGFLPWGALYAQFQRMEMRGQVRRGYFVRGLSGVQFALPEAVEDLRAWNTPDAPGAGDLVLVNACDPALIYGSALAQAPGSGQTNLAPEVLATWTRLPSNYVVLLRGVPIISLAHGEHRWCALSGLDEATVSQAVELLRAHLTREGGLCANPRRVLVNTWNGEPPQNTAARDMLRRLGFRHEPPGMVWDGLALAAPPGTQSTLGH